MSGQVRERYWRAPTRLRYEEGSLSGSPESKDSVCAIDIGDLTGLALDMLLLRRRSRI
jgi:hypothetical protein